MRIKISKTFLICIFLFFLTFFPRLYRINNPIADWHSWRQADTAAVTRNFVKDGFNPLFPRFDSFNSLNEFGLQNPERYFFAEFPLYNIIVYPFYTTFGFDLKTFVVNPDDWLTKVLWNPIFNCREGICSFPLDVIFSRLTSVIASSLATIFLFLLTKRLSSQGVALVAAIFFAVLPYNIYFGRVTMADPLHIMLSVLALYFASLWSDKLLSYPLAILTGLAYAGALLTKPYALVLLLPIAYLIFKNNSLKKIVAMPTFYVGLALALAPFLLWRWHITQHPEGQFGTSWLFNAGEIRGTGAYFRWLIFDRMNRLILATGGFVLFWIGLLVRRDTRAGWFYHAWLAGILVFFWIIAKGNVTHDYYQMPLVPVASIFVAKGIRFVLMYGEGFRQKILNLFVICILLTVTMAFGWYEIRGYFNINREEIVESGRYIDANLPKTARIIAPYNFDPAFLYQTNRHGWTIAGDKLPQFVKEGATHLVTVDYDEYNENLANICPIVKKTEKWKLIELRNCNLNYGHSKN